MATKLSSADDETLVRPTSPQPVSAEEQEPLAGKSGSTECLLFPMESSDGIVEKKVLAKELGSAASVNSREEVRVGVSQSVVDNQLLMSV